MWDQLSWILSSLVQVSTKALWIQLRVMLLITIITWAPRWGSNSAQMLRISNQQWMKNSQRRWRHHHSWSMTHSRKDRPDDRDHVTPIISQSHLRFKAVFTILINTILIHIFPILHKRFNLLSVCCRNKTKFFTMSNFFKVPSKHQRREYLCFCYSSFFQSSLFVTHL